VSGGAADLLRARVSQRSPLKYYNNASPPPSRRRHRRRDLRLYVSAAGADRYAFIRTFAMRAGIGYKRT